LNNGVKNLPGNSGARNIEPTRIEPAVTLRAE
jgi:hypothetical protein